MKPAIVALALVLASATIVSGCGGDGSGSVTVSDSGCGGAKSCDAGTACKGSGCAAQADSGTACKDGGCAASADSGAACKDGGCPAAFAVCPTGLDPTFDSIRTKILEVSCGTGGSICHSSEGGTDSGELILASDPYTALLGPDGTGAPASNISGSIRTLRRVVPGDPDHSFLILKLSTKVLNDPMYGAGMPRTDPGSVCPETLSTIRDWIAAGAKP
jgi:hypothetical protein